MRTFKNVIFLIAMATICRTVSSTEQPAKRQLTSLHRRFLFYTTSPTFQHPFTSFNGGTFLNKPCNPAVQHCRLQCVIGFLEGSNGCQFCACNTNNTIQQSTTLGTQSSTNIAATSTQPTSVYKVTTLGPTPNPVATLGPTPRQTTSIFTTLGPTPRQTTQSVRTLGPTPRQTTQSARTLGPTPKASSTSSGLTPLSDPCIPSQKTCAKNCGGDYIKGPGNCQYCLCASNIPMAMRTTIPPLTMLPPQTKNATVPHYLDLSPTSEACIMAKVICNQKCDHGFVSRPSDCLYCSCQTLDDEYNVDEVAVTALPNPCVLNSAPCRANCPNGYVTGPRDCKFCSCK